MRVFRPIALYRTAHRVLWKGRKGILTARTGTFSDPEVNMRQRRQVVDAPWSIHSRFQTGRSDNKSLHAVEIQLGITKAFENLDRRKLLAAAMYLGFPIFLLRMSLAYYAWARRLTLNEVVCQEVWPQFGIAAGSTGAIYELIAYTLGPVRRIRELSQLPVDPCTVMTLLWALCTNAKSAGGHGGASIQGGN